MPRGDSDLAAQLELAAGFGDCARCPFLQTGAPDLCTACAQRIVEPLAESAVRCSTCDRPLEADGSCRNPVRNMGERWFERNHSIAMRSGRLEAAISEYKYRGIRRWATIFGRILAGYLDANVAAFHSFDLIAASPAYMGADASRDWHHTREVLQAAEMEQQWEPGWPFDLAPTPAIIKTVETPRMVGTSSYQERKKNAETVLRGALSVPRPSRVRGLRVLVFDDVFTDGLTLRETARALATRGREVSRGPDPGEAALEGLSAPAIRDLVSESPSAGPGSDRQGHRSWSRPHVDG